MRPVTLNLDVLVRDPVNDNPWPGVAETIDFNDATCPAVDDEETSWLVTQVFVVLGYDSDQGDGSPAPAGWQVFSQGDAAPLIAQWLADGLEFHAATQITCSNDPANFYVVSDSFFDVLNAFTSCCGAPNIQTQALSFKISNAALEPGVEYVCGTEAIFRWLAIFGSENPGDGAYQFAFTLYDQAQNPANTKVFDITGGQVPFTQTQQLQKSWPADFIGMVATDGTILVPNSQEVLGPNDKRIGDYDFGTVLINAGIYDNAAVEISASQTAAALPGTLCGEGCASPYPAETTLPDATVGTPYSATIQLQGAGPWQINAGNKPSWMTVSAPDVNGLVTLGGTPDAPIDDFEFIYTAANCGNDLDNSTEHTLILDILQAFEVVTHPNPSALNFSESIYVPFLDVFMAWSNSDDASGTRVATSPDGITWTLQNTGAFASSIQEAAAGTDRVIFVGSSGNALMTVDGVNFTTFSMPQAIQHLGIAYSPTLDLFVIVAQQGANRVFTTVDGSSVNTVTAPVLNNWCNIAWSPDLAIFAAVASTGTGNQVMTSPDGTTWTVQTTPGATRQWTKIVWENGRFYVLSQNGTERLMYSPDGVNWTLINLSTWPSFWGTDLAYGNGLYVITASQSAGSTPRFLRSFDGLNWTSGGLSPTEQWTAINFKQSLNRFSITGLGSGSGFRVATIDWLP